MQLGLRTVVREAGTALAVLAMYALLLLAPWHQASALQHDLADLGYATIGTVDICAPALDQDEQPDELECPIAGIGKSDFVLPAPGAIVLPPPHVAAAVDFAFGIDLPRSAIPAHVGQARAPPVTV